MSHANLIEALASHPFLEGMRSAHVERLAELCHAMTITPGQYLGREREAANALYLLRSGRVAIEMQKPDHSLVHVQTMGAGEVVGWSWLVAPHHWRFDMRVLDTVQALALDGDKLRLECESDHDLGYEVLKRLLTVIVGRLAATRRQVLDMP